MKKTSDQKIFNVISYALITIIALLCLIPFALVVVGSFTDEKEIIANGFSLFPHKFSLAAYKLALKDPVAILRAYGVTVSLTVIGTAIGLFIVTMTAYVLQRKDFKWRNKFSFFFYFTTLFSGGLVPWFILMVRYLDLKDSYLALLLPPMLSVFNIILMRSYLAGIPNALVEAATIDGAGDFQIFLKVILPLAKPALATVGLFIAIGYWNDWYNSMLFINNDKLYSLQYYLYKTVNSVEAYKNIVGKNGGNVGAVINLPSESLKMALTVIVTGPIILVYPFIQKYFVSGITLGAVKE
ncbi:carbohydrate ABC transporter permease [Inconstantimicrobium mannanitabidum]|uniref:Sugar ABC transporter permease n=1 Tax=Inconstantimicrobium mannanitabidum TaxID=1604901 RepID=A0ACB5R9S2_9CLOT|nr:carbohydrate ABC transporter permease [Clostridium sp. TW13]GKX65786.1 sugar ABC transporter permease [Clostridium sp. TW13]